MSDEPAGAPLAQSEQSTGPRIVTESAIYGLILVSALLIVVGRGEQSSWETFIKVLGTVLVFWVAHVFAHVVAQLSAGRSNSPGAVSGDASVGEEPVRLGAVRRAFSHAFAHSAGLLLAAVVPLVIILAGVLTFISGETATWTALWVDVALLGVLGFLGAGGWTRRLGLRLAAGTITALLGVSIMLLKAFIH